MADLHKDVTYEKWDKTLTVCHREFPLVGVSIIDNLRKYIAWMDPVEDTELAAWPTIHALLHDLAMVQPHSAMLRIF